MIRMEGFIHESGLAVLPDHERPAVRKMVRYAISGALGTFAHYLVFLSLVNAIPSRWVAASMAGALIGAAINYALNYRYCFASNRPHRKALPRYLLVAALGLVINAAVMLGLAPFPHFVTPLLAQGCATAAVLAVGFLLNNYWTFTCHPS